MSAKDIIGNLNKTNGHRPECQCASCLSPQQTLTEAVVGTRIWFAGEKKPYRVRARCERYLVCTKPFNPRKTVLYCIVDLEEGVRGPENLIFGMGAESDQDCEEMIKRLQGIDDMSAEDRVAVDKVLRSGGCVPSRDMPIQTEVSHRNRVPLEVVRIETP